MLTQTVGMFWIGTRSPPSMHSQNIGNHLLSTLDGRPAEALVRLMESGIDVHRRHQFFVWARGNLNELIPHTVLLCASYERALGTLKSEVMNGVPVSPAILARLTEDCSPLMQYLTNSWLRTHGKPLWLSPHEFEGSACVVGHERWIEAGLRSALVHGVSRPQRLAEIESLFVLWSAQEQADERSLRLLDLVLPCLHSTYRRVLDTERRLAWSRTPPASGSLVEETGMLMSPRERQILHEVREGRSTQEIGELLDISPYTVKNHVQNILRKLGATTRAHAVTQALKLGMLDTPIGARPTVSSSARPYPAARAAPVLCPTAPAAAPRSLRSRGAGVPRSPVRCPPPPPLARRALGPLRGRPPSASQ